MQDTLQTINMNRSCSEPHLRGRPDRRAACKLADPLRELSREYLPQLLTSLRHVKNFTALNQWP